MWQQHTNGHTIVYAHQVVAFLVLLQLSQLLVFVTWCTPIASIRIQFSIAVRVTRVIEASQLWDRIHAQGSRMPASCGRDGCRSDNALAAGPLQFLPDIIGHPMKISSDYWSCDVTTREVVAMLQAGEFMETKELLRPVYKWCRRGSEQDAGIELVT